MKWKSTFASFVLDEFLQGRHLFSATIQTAPAAGSWFSNSESLGRCMPRYGMVASNVQVEEA